MEGNIFSKQPKNLKNDCERRADRVCQIRGKYYGTPRTYVEQQLEAGKDVILEIEIQGALKVKERFPDTLLLFVTPPSVQRAAQTSGRKRDRDHGGDRVQTGKGSGGVRVHGSV